ncbi:MAG: bifunctional acetate--CoA ligase family protein/GNAT family N-acetyltransferase [Candidatus Kinetoplastibacterium crithidii]|nr:MAG: bifunctional acetate--CoA ligase family protein/GNAT family N-acetyltransferase [Candidatus Kinetoplastibacterium crithidii]
MSRHFLTSLFEPRSVLLVIDSQVKIRISISNIVTKILHVDYSTISGFHLKENFIEELLPEMVDLAVICISRDLIFEALDFISVFKPKSLIILHCPVHDRFDDKSIFFCKKWAIDNQCELLGPESSGIQRPHIFLNISLYNHTSKSGKVALITQSRSIAASVMDWAEDVSVGFSLIASVGKKDSLSISKILDYLIWDIHTDSIVLYLEDITGIAREFISALRALARVKPVIVLKAGQDDYRADLVFSAVMRRAGAVRVQYFIHLFSALKVLSYPNKIYGRNIVLLSNGSGPPQLASDMMNRTSILMKAHLSIETLQYLESFIEKDGIKENIIILYKPITSEIIYKIINALLIDKRVDGILILLTPDFSLDSFTVTKSLAEITSKTKKPVVTCLMGDAEMRPLRKLLNSVGTYAFRTPESSAYAMGVLAEYYYNQQMLLQVQPSLPFYLSGHIEEGRKLIKKAILKKNLFLDRKEIESLCGLFDINFSKNINVNQEIGPITINVWSDMVFGPVIALHGGASNDFYQQENIGIDIPPLNNFLANLLIERSGVYKNNIKPTVVKEVFNNLQHILVQISELVSEFPEIDNLSIKDFFVGKNYLRSLDTKILLRSNVLSNISYKEINYPHMAIHPYPVDLIKKIILKNNMLCTIRPIRPEDAEILQGFIRKLSDKTRYMRFISAMKELTPKMLAHYTQIDYHRELALVVVAPEKKQYNNDVHAITENMMGFVHYLYNEDGIGAEYALVVGDEWQRLGIGRHLMTYILEIARKRGLDYINGYVLKNNKPMLTLLEKLGFSNIQDKEDPSIRLVRFNLKK